MASMHAKSSLVMENKVDKYNHITLAKEDERMEIADAKGEDGDGVVDLCWSIVGNFSLISLSNLKS